MLSPSPIATRRPPSCCANPSAKTAESKNAPSPTSPAGAPSASRPSGAPLRGEFDQLPATPVCGPVFGLLFALKQLADELGLTAALGRTRAAKLALFLVLARLAHQGSRLSAVRWAADQAVAEVLGLGTFDEDDLYAALDDSERPPSEDRASAIPPLPRAPRSPAQLAALRRHQLVLRRPAQRVGRVRLQSRRQARQEANCDRTAGR